MATEASIVVTGLDAIIRGFRVLPSQVNSDVRESLAPVLRDMRGQLASYPAERPNQRYRRSFRLEQGWAQAQEKYVVHAGGGIDLVMENKKADYVEHVQGDDQGVLFIGRWQTVSSIQTAFEGDITIAVEDGVVNAMRRLGL